MKKYTIKDNYGNKQIIYARNLTHALTFVKDMPVTGEAYAVASNIIDEYEQMLQETFDEMKDYYQGLYFNIKDNGLQKITDNVFSADVFVDCKASGKYEDVFGDLDSSAYSDERDFKDLISRISKNPVELILLNVEMVCSTDYDEGKFPQSMISEMKRAGVKGTISITPRNAQKTLGIRHVSFSKNLNTIKDVDELAETRVSADGSFKIKLLFDFTNAKY